MIERGANFDNFDDDDEGQSEDESNLSGASQPNDKTKSNKAATTGKLGELVTSGKTMTQEKANANL